MKSKFGKILLSYLAFQMNAFASNNDQDTFRYIVEPDYELSPELIDNRDKFFEPFFSKISLERRNEPVQLTEEVSKDYLFPTFYGDVLTSVAIFYADYSEAEKLVLDSSYAPVKIAGSRTLIAISSYRYNKVHQMTPYNEGAVSILLLPKGKNKVNPINLRKKLNEAVAQVISMPVTSEENMIRGHKIWGLPKTTNKICIYSAMGKSVTTIYEDEKLYFRLIVPMDGKRDFLNQKTRLLSQNDDHIYLSQSENSGTYFINTFYKTLLLRNTSAGTPFLIVGNSPSAEILKRLKIEPHPLRTQFSFGTSNYFDLPSSIR